MRRQISSKFLKGFLFACMWTLSFGVFAQNITVHGTVKDAQGEPLIGASVKVKGSATGSMTDFNGNYSIPNVSNKASLEVSYVGMKTQTVSVNGRTNLNVVMEDDNALLDEVVIVGYGVARKSDLTGSVVSIKPKENDAARSLSVDGLLQGKVPGMNVVGSTSGGPGAAGSVLIRGANSLRGDNQPLYVIDNVPQASTGEFAAVTGDERAVAQNPLTSLNPNDIESVQVLKDASATAIYGSRGANGVVIITTKKGLLGKPKVTFGANYSIDQVTRLRRMLKLKDFVGYKNAQQGVTVSPYFHDVNGEMRYTYDPAAYIESDPKTYSVIENKDWQNEVYRTALSQNYNLSINGGTGGTTYFVSGSYKNLEGIIKQTGLQLGSFRSNLNMELNKNLKLALLLSGSIRKNNMMSGGNPRGGVTGSIIDASLFASPYEIPANDPVWNTADLAALEARSTPLSWLSDYDDITNEKNFRGSVELNWTITPQLFYTLRTGTNYTIQDRKRWFGLQLFRGFNDNGNLEASNYNQNNMNFENLLNYQLALGKEHKMTLMAGVTYDQYQALTKNVTGKNFNYRDLRADGLSLATTVTEYAPVQRDYQLLSYLSRLNVNLFNDKILFTATMRADGSSKFAKGHRWGYFPSAALAYRLEKESFLKDQDWIDLLKIRAGFGITGNQSIPPYSTLNLYSQGPNSYYATNGGQIVNAINTSGLPNAGIKWETTKSYNAGVDFGFFSSRLLGSVDVYYKETNDLLVSKNIPLSTAYTSIITNLGSLSNQGVELTLSGDIIRTPDFNWNLGGNISFNTPKIIKLGLPEGNFGNEKYVAFLGNTLGDNFNVSNIFIEGRAPGLLWGFKTDGIYQQGETIPITKDLNNTVPVPGDVKVMDQNGDNIIDTKDLMVIGNPNPKFTFGFQSSFRYKDLTVSAAFNGVYGNQILNTNLRYEATPSRQNNTIRESIFGKMYTAENPSNTYPSARYQIPNYVFDRYVEDGSYLRWADLTIGYSLPRTWTSELGIRGINVFGSVKNLLVLTKYSGNDPEVSSYAFDGLRPGIDYKSFPNSRSFTFGVNVNF